MGLIVWPSYEWIETSVNYYFESMMILLLYLQEFDPYSFVDQTPIVSLLFFSFFFCNILPALKQKKRNIFSWTIISVLLEGPHMPLFVQFPCSTGSSLLQPF